MKSRIKFLLSGAVLISLLALCCAAPCFSSQLFNPKQYSFSDEMASMTITNVNIDNFPGVHLFVRVVDDSGYTIYGLEAENFEVRENGLLVSHSCDPEFGYLAVSLVMDQSGSMSPFPQQVISSCSTFVAGLEVLDKGAIVKFSSLNDTLTYVDVPMTYDKELLFYSIGNYHAYGLTALWEGTALGIDECYFEPEKKAVIAFTDGQNNQWGTYCANTLPELAGNDIAIYTIGIGNILDPDSMTYISEMTGGYYLHIENPGQMTGVLEDIREDVNNLYDIYYVSPNPDPDSTLRAIQVVCDYEGTTVWDTTSYMSPATTPPVISLSVSTANMLGVSQTANQQLHIECQIRTDNTITSKRVYYKTTGDLYFAQGNLIFLTGRTYYYNIPSSYVQNPGVDFYIQATDNEGNTVTLPQYNPGYLPFNIPVLPNYAPQISYYPPDMWLTRRSLEVEAVITDNSSVITQASLFYRVPETFFYHELPMQFAGIDRYTATIEGPELNTDDDIEMFIAAWDNLGVVNYWYSSDEPYYLDIVNEMPPTPPCVALEPDTLPILIPASGGSFDYTLFVINPIPDTAECDVWVDWEQPDGVMSEPTVIYLDLELLGGETVIDFITQEVPATSQPGNYNFFAYTGDYSTLTPYYTASFPFSKSAVSTDGRRYTNGWRWYPRGSMPYEGESEIITVSDHPYIKSAGPNPFNVITNIEFYVHDFQRVNIAVYNIAGEQVAVLSNDYFPQGKHQLYWNAGDNASGIYFCNLMTNNTVETVKLLLVK